MHMKSYSSSPYQEKEEPQKYICGGGERLPACLLLCENNRPFCPGHRGVGVLGKYMRKKESR